MACGLPWLAGSCGICNAPGGPAGGSVSVRMGALSCLKRTGNGMRRALRRAACCCKKPAGCGCGTGMAIVTASCFAAIPGGHRTGGGCRLSGVTLELKVEAANMLIQQEKITRTAGARAICLAAYKRRHRLKMNKAEFRELIAPTPVYPGVDRLYENSGEQV